MAAIGSLRGPAGGQGSGVPAALCGSLPPQPCPRCGSTLARTGLQGPQPGRYGGCGKTPPWPGPQKKARGPAHRARPGRAPCAGRTALLGPLDRQQILISASEGPLLPQRGLQGAFPRSLLAPIHECPLRRGADGGEAVHADVQGRPAGGHCPVAPRLQKLPVENPRCVPLDHPGTAIT